MTTPLQIRPRPPYQRQKPVRNFKPWHIYALKDPRDSAVRYVGVTTNPKRRFTVHLITHDGTRRARWIEELSREGLRPVQEILESGAGDSRATEQRWMDFYRVAGCDLTNIAPAGVIASRFPTSTESRARTSKRHKGKVLSAATRAKLSLANIGKKHSPESRAKMSAARRGKTVFSAEHRANLAQAATGKRHPQDVIDRIAAKARGRKMPKEFGQRMSDERKGKPWNEKRRQAQAARNGARPSHDYEAIAAKMRGRKQSDKARANMKAAWERRREDRTALNREVWAKRKAAACQGVIGIRPRKKTRREPATTQREAA